MSTEGERIAIEKCKNLDWCLCIFFSVDLEGATKYKTEARQEQYEGGPKIDNDWCAVFKNFYIDFPNYFKSAYTVLSAQIETKSIRQPITPVLWKFIGDEILFYAPIEDSCQVLEHLYAFQQTISNYNDALEKNEVKVRCKGTAWVAGFPFNNRIILIEAGNGRSIVDFIGSSIDAGFRISKYTTSRRLVISFDLLWMLLIARKKYDKVQRYNFDIRFYGEYALKGVLKETEYPIFWLHWKRENDDRWKIPSRIEDYDDILGYCQKFSEKLGNDAFIRPFVENDPSGLLTAIPDRFETYRSQLKEYLKASEKVALVEAEVQQREKTKTLPANIRVLKRFGDN